ncbi:MAG: hypothetical protein J5485_00480, partial [Candidatus Methanomethylophilaceae archaeon]|nr:hypothetical protein [Candidatus Methanomethylophilaceae archaeon]
FSGDVSHPTRIRSADEGQRPCAAGVSCSDSRVIPEAVFSAGIGELFVIRSAGNVGDGCTLGSLEYAVGHMGGGGVVVVMGHTRNGAIAVALKGFHRDHKRHPRLHRRRGGPREGFEAERPQQRPPDIRRPLREARHHRGRGDVRRPRRHGGVPGRAIRRRSIVRASAGSASP